MSLKGFGGSIQIGSNCIPVLNWEVVLGEEMSTTHIREDKLDFWLKHNQNVLLVGKHGVGKTSMVEDCFERAGLVSGETYLYFSASTLDPWVDLVGVPKEVKDEKTGLTYLELVRPRALATGKIVAIFFDEYNRCLTGDTKIRLLDGHSVPIKDLIGRDHFYVYSFDKTTNKICVGKGHSARLTQKQAKILKVTLDNGTSIKCTEDHPFLMNNGAYLRANQLFVGCSLMPLYRIYNKDGYEKVWQPKKNSKWELTYKLADQFNLINNFYQAQEYKEHRHHVDFNKSNNSPENITRLSEQEHRDAHNSNFESCSFGGKNAHLLHPDLYAKTIGTKESKRKAIENSATTRRTCDRYKQLRSKLSSEMYTKEHREQRSQITKQQWKSGQFAAVDRKAAACQKHITRSYNLFKNQMSVDQILNMTEECYDILRKTIKPALPRTPKIRNYFGSFTLFKEKIAGRYDKSNHRVVNIEECGYEDVYDISVDKYNNFALECGVFVHNSPPKVRNAVMELIQKKSINGMKFPNLKIVWAAINPEEDGTYDVERIDPAQEDRFQIKVEMPYKPSQSWFASRFNAALAKAATEWWEELSEEQRNLVSPRRLEYAVNMFTIGGDVRDVLPKTTGVTKLLERLRTEPILETLNRLMKAKDSQGAEYYLKDATTFQNAIVHILKENDLMKFCLPAASKEHLHALIASNKRVAHFMCQHKSTFTRFEEVIEEVFSAGTNRALQQDLSRELSAIKSGRPTSYDKDGNEIPGTLEPVGVDKIKPTSSTPDQTLQKIKKFLDEKTKKESSKWAKH